MIIHLHLRNTPDHSVDARRLTPQSIAGLSHWQIENLSIGRNSTEIRIKDLFDVEVSEFDPDRSKLPDSLVLTGDFTSFHRIGESLEAGNLWINGSVGSEVAAGMKGGVCVVVGHASDHAAQAIRGGLLAICGHCRHDLASPAPGKRAGMAGGDILVGGNVGDRVAHRMRRGTIHVAGQAGSHGCQQMIAGTVVTKGAIGREWCIGMKRGSLIEFTSLDEPQSTHAGLSVAREFELSFLQILWKHLKAQHRYLADVAKSLEVAFPFRPFAFPQSNWATRQVGDTLIGGQGEWLRIKAPIPQ